MSSQSYLFNPRDDRMAVAGSGLQLPRLTTSQRVGLSVSTADAGLTVFDSTTATIWFWDGTAWVELSTGGGSGVYVSIYTGATQNPQVFGWTIVDGRATQVGLDAEVTTGTTSITLTQGASFDGDWDLEPLDASLAIFAARNCTFGTFAPGALTNLSYLDCIGNGFTLVPGSSFDALDLSGCTNALTVRLGEGVTTSMTLPASLFSLTINTVSGVGVNYPAIDTSGSSVTTISLTLVIAPSFDATGCTALATVVIDGCQLPSITFSGCSNLTSASITATPFTTLSFAGCNLLETVVLNNCTFPTLDLTASTSIETLSITSATYTSLDISGCPSLVSVINSESIYTTFNASGSSIQSYTGSCDSATGTQSIDLSGCTSLTGVAYTGLGGSASVATINCSGCTALTTVTFQGAPLTSVNFTGCTSLTDLNLRASAGNYSLNLTNCTSFVSLLLGENSSGPTGVASINLTGCSSLAGIDFDGFPYADISSLTTITVSTLPALVSANLVGAGLNVASVNAILVALDANGLPNGAVNLSGGTSAAPTGAGIVAKANLIGKGWTVLTN